MRGCARAPLGAPSQRPQTGTSLPTCPTPSARGSGFPGGDRVCNIVGAAPDARRRRRPASFVAAASSPSSSSSSTYAATIGLASVQGPRSAMEDVARVEAHAGEGGDFLYVGVMDGHGGDASALWLREGLFDAVASHLPAVAAALPAVRAAEEARARDEAAAATPVGAAGAARRRAAGSTALDRREQAAQQKAAVEAPRAPPPLADALTRAFLDADAALLAHLRATSPERLTGASGASATVLLVHRPTRTLVAASAGDSLAVLARGGSGGTGSATGPSSLARLCRAHRVQGTGPDARDEAARVEAAGGWVRDGRVCGVLAVSRALGDPEFKGAQGLGALMDEGTRLGWWDAGWAAEKRAGFRGDPVVAEPDVHAMALRGGGGGGGGGGGAAAEQSQGGDGAATTDPASPPPEDEFVVVASDGLWDAVPPADALRYARAQFKSGRDAQQVAEALTALALKRYTADNVAVAVVDLLGPERRARMAGGEGAKKKGGGGFFGGLFGR